MTALDLLQAFYVIGQLGAFLLAGTLALAALAVCRAYGEKLATGKWPHQHDE